MEFVAGKSLFHSAHGLCVEQQQAVKLIIDICHGLAHAHEHGILHRDIKPANILLDAHAHPKLGDFGLARAQGYRVKEGEQIFGTVGYTAPEVLEPPFVFDARADIFSIGVMLHELLTGKLPMADERSASQICGCNARLDAVIAKCIHDDLRLRYSSANELAADLDAISSLPERPLVPLLKTAQRADSPAGLKTPNLGNKPVMQKPRLPSQKTASSGSNRVLALVVLVIVLGLAGYVASNEDSRKEFHKLTTLIKNTVNSYSEPPVKQVVEIHIDKPKSEPEEAIKQSTQEVPEETTKQSTQEVPEEATKQSTQEVPGETTKQSTQEVPGETTKQSTQEVPESKAIELDTPKNTPSKYAQEVLEKNRAALEENLLAYKAELEAGLSEVNPDKENGGFALISKTIADWQANGNIIPENLPSLLRVIPDVVGLHKNRLEKQTKLVGTGDSSTALPN
jgi:serine/threonine protein kinase